MHMHIGKDRLGGGMLRTKRSPKAEHRKRGLLAGSLGLCIIGAAVNIAGIRDEQYATESLAVMSDASGEENNVSVSERKPIETRKQETKKIALTFDDGPHPYYTDQLLDGLAERNVKATFFLLGQNIEGREAIVERMAKEGHLIGNHTFYHIDITRLDQEEACREIRKTTEQITAITGQPVEYIRPPFGNWEKDLECEVMMIPIFWSVDTLDWTTANADQIVQKVVTNVEENDIILMHDSYESTVEAALRIIDLLTAKGYEFVTADQLILE